MTTDQDIYASAKLLIEHHGNDAEDIALARMLVLIEKDDVKGASVWLSIMDAMNTLTDRAKQKYLL